ncbi:peroxiredoxin family protein [bacterium]|nr:MAG: peroxiredoxin family protein [bacterium]
MVLKHDVGGQAPGITLKDPAGRDITLESYQGKSNVVLVFFTGGYDRDVVRNLRALKESYPRVRDMDADVIAITPELPGKVKALVEGEGLPFPVLSDPELNVVKGYDVYDPAMNWTYPAAFIIDKNGVIQYAFRGASTPNTPPVEYILLKLMQMKEGKAPAAASAKT